MVIVEVDLKPAVEGIPFDLEIPKPGQQVAAAGISELFATVSDPEGVDAV